MTKLSVNINKLATLRNARGKNNPNLLQAARDIISYGAEGITVHPRPDGRHIRIQDVYDIAAMISNEFNKIEFNIEGYPNKDFLDLVKKVKPTQCTFVPDPPHVLTSNAGWILKDNFSFLKEVIQELHEYNIRTALFIDPYHFSEQDVELLKITETNRVELYTEAYADSYHTPQKEKVLAVYKNAAKWIQEIGVELNAGHDLDLKNLRDFIQAIPYIKEVSIGHALICDSLYYGLEETIKRYLACL